VALGPFLTYVFKLHLDCGIVGFANKLMTPTIGLFVRVCMRAFVSTCACMYNFN
jgi:hypothetical protein